MTNLITMGTDAEFFVKSIGSDKIIAADPKLIKGTKEDPYPLSGHTQIQLDNVLGEMTCRPAKTANQLRDYIVYAKKETKAYLVNKGLVPVFKSHHTFTPKELRTPWGSVFGCEPDFPADINDKMPKPSATTVKKIRTGSGHMHFGVEGLRGAEDVIQYVRLMDFMLMPSLLRKHNDPIRRRMYGQAGRFRFKPYGFEYRTPDNWWVDNAKEVAPAIWLTANQVFNHDVRSPYIRNALKHHSDLCTAINTGDVDKVSDIADDSGLFQLYLKEDPDGGAPKKVKPTPTGWILTDDVLPEEEFL